MTDLLKSILFKSIFKNSSILKNFLNLAAYLRTVAPQICGPIDEISKLLLNKMDFSKDLSDIIVDNCSCGKLIMLVHNDNFYRFSGLGSILCLIRYEGQSRSFAHLRLEDIF